MVVCLAVIQGVICPRPLNTSRAVGTGTVDRERHSDRVLRLSGVSLLSVLLLLFVLEAGIAAKYSVLFLWDVVCVNILNL